MLLALFLVNSGLTGSTPHAAVCLAITFACVRQHDPQLLVAITVPLGVLGAAVLIQDIAYAPESQLIDLKYALTVLIFGGSFGYVITLAIRTISANRALTVFALFSAAHAIWALIFVKYAPLESNITYHGFGMQRANVAAVPLLRYWSYDNQIIGITYFTVLPIACVWAAFPVKKKSLTRQSSCCPPFCPCIASHNSSLALHW